MRVLYVIDSLAPGGAETSLAAMAPGLVREGLELHVLPLGARRDLAPKIEETGAVVHGHRQAEGRIDNVRSVVETARVVRPDLVHTTLFEADLAGRIGGRVLRIPVSSSIVSDSYSSAHYARHRRSTLHAARAADAATARLASRFHAISRAIAESVALRLAIPQSRVEVIPRGRDPLAFPYRPAGLRGLTRQELGIPESAQVVLSVGRLDPEKGQHHLLAALPMLASQHPRLITLIAGKEGRASRELRTAASAGGTDVRFLGHRADVAALMAAADVFCFPSEREGFGGALIEALAVGCPVVASDIPATREVLGTGAESTGQTIDPDDAAALAIALGRTLDSGAALLPATLAGRQRFERLFTIDAVTTEMTGFFDRALRAPHRRVQ